MDSGNHRIIEVTPEKEVVWEMDISNGGSWLFQADRVGYNEPRYIQTSIQPYSQYNLHGRELLVNCIILAIMAVISTASIFRSITLIRKHKNKKAH